MTNELMTQIALAVFRINGRLLARGDELVAPLALTSARWQMLGAIALAGQPQTVPQIAEAMGVTRQGAQKQLNLLLQEGQVAAAPNPRHLRSPLYALTAAGERAYAAAMKLNSVWMRRLAAGSKRDELAASLSVLNDLYRRLDAPVPAPGASK